MVVAFLVYAIALQIESCCTLLSAFLISGFIKVAPMSYTTLKVLCLTMLLGAGLPRLEAAIYSISDLGTLGGTTSSALDVNNLRQVTGNSLVASDPGSSGSLLRAYNWTSGTMTALPALAPLPAEVSPFNRFARGYAINDSGYVVGEFNNNSSRAFVFNPNTGVTTGLTRLSGGTDNGVAHDINNAGTIVGISSNGTASRATKWIDSGSGYVPSDLGTIAGTTTATGRAWAINQNGVAVGLSTNAAVTPTSQATMWNGATITNLTSLGNGTRFSQAYGVNTNNVAVGSSSTGQTVGELIGTSSTTGITRGFVWNAGVMTELAPFNLYTPSNNGTTTNYHSVANDLNDAGLIVGNSQRISGSAAVATLWQNGIPIDLNTLIPAGSGWNLLNAESINDAGDIVGFGSFGGSNRAFMLTAVPEPSSLILLLGGGASAFVMLRRRKHLRLAEAGQA